MAHSGRPELAHQIVGPARKPLAIGGTSNAQRFVRSVSYLWRFFDHLEAAYPSVGKITDVRMVPGPIWDAFTDHLAEDEQVVSNRMQIYKCCTEMVTTACAAMGIELSLPSSAHDSQPSSKRRTVENPYTDAQTREIVDAFRSERLQTEARIRHANEMADNNSFDLMSIIAKGRLSRREHSSLLTPENVLHFVRTELLSSLPDCVAFEDRFGFRANLIGFAPEAMSLPSSDHLRCIRRARGEGSGLASLYRYFLPTLSYLVASICELVHLTAGNLQTIMDIDRTNWYRGDPATEAVIVASRKARARGALITWESKTNSEDTIYSIIKSAIEATTPLHRAVLARLNELQKAAPTPGVASELDRLLPLRNRVWIALSKKAIGPIGIEQRDLHPIANGILRQREVKEDGKPLTWSARRVRDGAVGDDAITKSFSISKLQKKLQQKSPRVCADYLNQPQLACLGTKAIAGRVSDLMDDAERRSSFWPERANSSDDVASAGRRSIILVMPGGKRWADRSLPHAIDSSVIQRKRLQK
jgi:hypothetical protein